MNTFIRVGVSYFTDDAHIKPFREILIDPSRIVAFETITMDKYNDITAVTYDGLKEGFFLMAGTMDEVHTQIRKKVAESKPKPTKGL